MVTLKTSAHHNHVLELQRDKVFEAVWDLEADPLGALYDLAKLGEFSALRSNLVRVG